MKYMIIDDTTGNNVGTATKNLDGTYKWDSDLDYSTVMTLNDMFKASYAHKLRAYSGDTYTYIPMTDLLRALE